MEFDIQTDRNYYDDLRQTYLALKLNFPKGRGYENCKTKKSKKKHKEKAKTFEDAAEEDQMASVLLFSLVNNILHSVFLNVEVYISNQRFYNS